MNPSGKNHTPNRVLNEQYRSSSNFWRSDRILQHHLQAMLDRDELSWLAPQLEWLGGKAAMEMDPLSLTADRQEPELIKRSPLGEELNEVAFHPSYRELMDIAVRSQMIHLKYEPSLREHFTGRRHRMGFALAQLFAMSELGVSCPLCMTDGAAWLLEAHASDEVKQRLIPKLSAKTADDLYSGAMFLTEKSGGSDVGRNNTTAQHLSGRRYRLNGEKWFCSNVNAEVILTLARTAADVPGTDGLSLFLVERHRGADQPGEFEIVRLKKKLGVRSMATGEVLFRDTEAIRIGELQEGFRIMTQMINLSRIYNAVAALGGMRRGLIEAWQYLDHRILFGERAVEKPLIRTKFHELGTLYVANFLLVWRTLQALDKTESGDEEERQRMRVLIPMAKWWSAESAVLMLRECMELQGGNGYIEDFIMPKLLRDVYVLPIWEGSGNVIVLDILRAMEKSNGMELLLNDMNDTFSGATFSGSIHKKWQQVRKLLHELPGLDSDPMQATAKPLFKELIRFYQLHLLSESAGVHTNSPWLQIAYERLESELTAETGVVQPAATGQIRRLIAWHTG